MRFYIYPILFLIFGNILNGQTISGKIIDKEGHPIANAFVYVNAGQQTELTNELGQFSFSDIQPTDTLQVQYLGYENVACQLRDKDVQESIIITLEEAVFNLDHAVISNNSQSFTQIAAIDLQTQPVNSSQEILRKVPGLVIGQHAGGGKAEQIFFRGFDIDHGTDINLTVDGIPVNMVSHAHGQGYSDLHFLIPETVARLDFGKGPYYSDKGNFTTAGYVDFQTKNYLKESSVKVEGGRFNTFRTVGLFNLLDNQEGHHAYVAGEFIQTDGPVESPQDFKRWNGFGKYLIQLPNNDQFSFTTSYFTSNWDASGQIPQRLIDQGKITRFGSVDNTEGGFTSRFNASIDYTKNLSDHTFFKNRIYFSTYDFELYSNFTFFLNDPENGDQIRQKENRKLFGVQSVLHHNFSLSDIRGRLKAGVGMRGDRIFENELSHTFNRSVTLNTSSLGNVNEQNYYGFVESEWSWNQVTLNTSLRVDHLFQEYRNDLENQSKTANHSTALTPHLNFFYTPHQEWQLYAKTGLGFHSNDARVVVGGIVDNALPLAYGADLGTIWKPTSNVWLQTALWYLQMQQEFVYVGDEGIVEPSGKTRRLGVDVSVRYQYSPQLFLNADINYAFARSIEEPSGQDYIPLAPDLTSSGGIVYKHPNGFESSLRYRYLRDRAANEDFSLTAKGYFLTDVNMNYHFSKFSVGIAIENLFNQEWNEAQFATTSRLKQEPTPVEEIHFTPGTPFFLKGTIQYSF